MIDSSVEIKIAALFDTWKNYTADKDYDMPRTFPYCVWQRDYVLQCFSANALFCGAPIRTYVDKRDYVDIWMKMR